MDKARPGRPSARSILDVVRIGHVRPNVADDGRAGLLRLGRDGIAKSSRVNGTVKLRCLLDQLKSRVYTRLHSGLDLDGHKLSEVTARRELCAS